MATKHCQHIEASLMVSESVVNEFGELIAIPQMKLFISLTERSIHNRFPRGVTAVLTLRSSLALGHPLTQGCAF